MDSGCEDRLKNMLVIDRKENPQRIQKLIKAEMLYVLKNYFSITNNDLDIDLNVNEEGEYVLSLKAISNSIKIPKCF